MEADSQEKREEEGSPDVDHGGVVERVVLACVLVHFVQTLVLDNN